MFQKFAVLFFAATIILLWSERSVPAAQKSTPDNARVVKCFADKARAGSDVTMQELRDCVGGWVTPRALLSCAFEGACPIIPDTLEGQIALGSVLRDNHWTTLTNLALDQSKLPPLPRQQAIDACKHTSTTLNQFQECMAQDLQGIFKLSKGTIQNCQQGGTINCVLASANDPKLTNLVACLGNVKLSAARLLACDNDPSVQAALTSAKACLAAESTDVLRRECLLKPLAGSANPVQKCLVGATNTKSVQTCLAVGSKEQAAANELINCIGDYIQPVAKCAGESLQGETGAVLRCLGDKKSVVDCAATSLMELPRAQKLAECNAKLPKEQAQITACAAVYLGSDAQNYGTCMISPGKDPEQCLINPKIKAAYHTTTCLKGAGEDALKEFDCISPQLGGDATKIASCISKKQKDETLVTLCLLPGNNAAAIAQRVYQCINTSHDAASAILNCAGDKLDNKSRVALSCISQAGSNRAQLAECAASAVLPPDQARLVSCAAQSRTGGAFVVCAAAPGMSEEWRIAAECAVESGGFGPAWVGCTAGQLTVAELTKCFSGGSCFGPSNTLVLALNTVLDDITKGPGPNNDIVNGLRNINKFVDGGPNSFINSPGQWSGGPNSLINNPGQIWGGDNSIFNNPGQILGGENSVAHVAEKDAQAVKEYVNGRLGIHL